MSRAVIDAALASRLHRHRFAWRRVGAMLAREDGRPAPYKADSVARAVRQHRRQLQQEEK